MLSAGESAPPDLTEEVDAYSAWLGDQRSHRIVLEWQGQVHEYSGMGEILYHWGH